VAKGGGTASSKASSGRGKKPSWAESLSIGAEGTRQRRKLADGEKGKKTFPKKNSQRPARATGAPVRRGFVMTLVCIVGLEWRKRALELSKRGEGGGKDEERELDLKKRVRERDLFFFLNLDLEFCSLSLSSLAPLFLLPLGPEERRE